MITEFKYYSTYKDSGVPWLRAMPKHREVLPNRGLFTKAKGGDHPKEQMLSVTIVRRQRQGIFPL